MPRDVVLVGEVSSNDGSTVVAPQANEQQTASSVITHNEVVIDGTYPTRPTFDLVKKSYFFSVFLTCNFPLASSG